MIRLGAAVAAVLAAGALAWAGSDLLSLPHGGDAFTNAVAGGADVRHFDAAAAAFERAVSGGRAGRAEAGLAAQRGDARLRSRAQTLFGVLSVADAASHRAHARRDGAAALGAFRHAVALDPANDDAAADLELLYAQRSGSRRRQRQAAGGSQGSGRKANRPGGRHRAGPGTSSGPGGGY